MESKKTPSADLNQKQTLFFSIGLVLSLSIMIIAFSYRVYDKPRGKVLTEERIDNEEIIDIPITEQLPPVPIVQQPRVVEVPNEQKIRDDIKIDMDIEIDINEQVREAAKMAPIAVEEEKEDPQQIFTVVEETAVPIGGMSAFYNYVKKSLKYPAQARRMNIEGKVFIEFVIEKDGAITDVKSVKGIGAGCDEEAVSIVQSSPAWNPAKQRGKPVRQRMVLPITFKLASRSV